MSAHPPRATTGMLRRLPRGAGADRVRRGPVTVVRADGVAGVGYAVGRSAGKAVARNRIRRRLREAVRIGVPSSCLDATFLVIGGADVGAVSFPDLVASVRDGFTELQNRRRSTGGLSSA